MAFDRFVSVLIRGASVSCRYAYLAYSARGVILVQLDRVVAPIRCCCSEVDLRQFIKS